MWFLLAGAEEDAEDRKDILPPSCGMSEGFESWVKMKVKVLVAQLCPTLCNCVDCSPSGSSVPGIFQTRILEWVAIPFSRGSS